MSQTLERWIGLQYAQSATAMMASISPTALRKHRPGFGQSIAPSKGSVVASPVLASYDPDPDYFFHWYRDSAVVIDALRILAESAPADPTALEHFRDFVKFSLSLQSLDGRELVQAPGWRARVSADFVKFLRTDADLAAAHGEAIAAETRVNADGRLDISSWPRPQNDGPPMRALTLLRWSRSFAFDRDLDEGATALLQADLRFTRRHWSTPCFDIWEEEKGLHYYTLCVSAAALEQGAAWLDSRGQGDAAQACRSESLAARRMLDDYWLAEQGYYRSRVLESGARSQKQLDISVILAAIHGGFRNASHGVDDARMQTTLSKIESLFDALYAINHNKPPGRGPALGRYAGDVYYSGGAYFFSTLGAAEFCFRAAAGSSDARAFVSRGDAYLETVRAFTPSGGDLSEQFDQHTGTQTSAKHLAWSYAAFISCIAARRAVR